jgi:glycosyltransferase involved in cell wall biosynthesis
LTGHGLPMKVLFISAWYPAPDRRNDGVFVREHAKSVRAAGDEVVVVHLADAPASRGVWHMAHETDVLLSEGIPTYHVASRRFELRWLPRRIAAKPAFWISYGIHLWSVIGAFRRVRRSGFKPDVIHAHVYTAGVPAVVVGRLFRTPVVITEHYTGFPLRTLPRGGLGRARFAFRRAARVLPVSESLRRAIEAYGISAAFEVIPNAVDTTRFFSDSEPHDRRAPARMLFVGRLEPTHHKGFPTLVAALKLLGGGGKRWTMEIVGDGPTRSEYEAMATGEGMGDSIRFHGSLPKADVAAEMREADLFVLSSRIENLPCVVIEALASGLPVVGTNVGGVPEMITDADGVLVDPEDPAALAAALERALAGLDSWDRQAIVARARDRYSLAAVGARLHDVYVAVARARV